MSHITLGTADYPIRSGHDVVADMVTAIEEMARRSPLPAMEDCYMHPGDFDLMVAGKDPGELQTSDGRKFWEWRGGGIRYWRGHKEFPRG